VVNYDVVVKIIDSYEGFLRSEMTASVTIFLETHKNVLTLPVKAIKRDQGKNVVYLMSSGGPQSREVKVGWKNSQWVEILSGLDEGETVLLESPPAE
jgi:macrolide-specific efflux system membrane fusion protein